ncbi:MAG: trigger factor [Azoarcus sp.]|nr:trigger factor [Azoarcus sp.]
MDSSAAENNTAVEDSGENPLVRRLTLTLNVQEIDKAVDVHLRRIASTVKMPGFRRGKAPLHLIRRDYGSEAREEALTESLGKAWQEAISGHDAAVVWSMREVESPGPEQRQFVVTFEVFPEFELADIAQISVARPVVEISAEDVDKRIQDMQMDQGDYHVVDRGAEWGDFVTVSYCSKMPDGFPPPDNASGTDREIILGERDAWRAFDAEIIGMESGDSKTFDFTYQEDCPFEAMAGKTVQFQLAVSEVGIWKKAEVNEEFAKMNGVADGDLNELRVVIEEDLKGKAQELAEKQLYKQVLDSLLAAHHFPVPEKLVENKARQHLEYARENMARIARRLGWKKYDPYMDFKRSSDMFTEKARRNIRLNLIFDKINELGDFRVSAENSSVAAEMLEQQFVDWVLAKAKIVDKPCSYDDLLEQASGPLGP